MKYVELRRVNTDESFVDLPDYVSVTFDSVWNPSPSIINLTYPLAQANSLGLQAGAFIAVLPDGVEIPDRYVLEQRQGVRVTNDGLVVTWSGRSMKAILEDDFVWPSAWPNPVPAGHAFLDANPGTIMKTFLTRSQARGFMTMLTHATFSGTVDSAGNAWPSVIDKNFSNGSSVLSVAQNLFEMGLIELRTNKFALEMYKPAAYSRHLSIDAVCFTAGKNIADESTQEDSSNFFTDTLMEGEGAAKTATDASSYSKIGRRRARYSQAGGIADPGTLQLLANTDLAQYTHVQTERSLAVTHQPGEPQPFVDYRVGDWVWLDVDGTPVEIQVQQVAVNAQRGQLPEVSITLGDILDSIEESLKRRIDNITGSNAGSYGPVPGTTGALDLAPAAPTGLGATFGIYVDDKGVNRAAATITWNEVSTNADGTPAYDIATYEVFMRDDSPTAAWQLIGKAEAGTPVAFYSPLPEATYKRFQVVTIDQAGKRSAASAEYRAQTPKDLTGPPQPSKPTGSTKAGTATLSWDGLSSTGASMGADFSYAEIHKSKTSNFAPGPATLHSRFTSAGFIDVTGGLLPGETWFFKLRGVDISGNVGTPSAQESITVASIVDADLSQAIKDEIDLAQSTATGAQTSATGANNRVDQLLIDLPNTYYNKGQVDTAVNNAASSGNKVVYSLNNASGTTRPDGKPFVDGDIWRKVDTEAANGRVIAEWTWKSGAWVTRQYSGAILTALDAGSISTGFLDSARIQAGSLTVGQTAGLSTILGRGADLITNGTGLAGNNTNFSAFDYNALDAPTGASGSFVIKTTANQSAQIDDLLAFDPTKAYRFSFKCRQTVAGIQGRMYGFISPFDAANLSIQPNHYMYGTGTTTTLAADLKPGDTTITLTSSANWYGTSGKNAGTSTHLRGVIIWDYVDSFGKAWPTESYSRNSWLNLYADNSITGNVITLSAPWPAANGTHVAGTAISQSSSGGSYIYMSTVQNVLVPETWTTYAETFSAGVMPASAQAVPAGGAATWATGVPPGTAKIKVGWLLNYPAGTGGKHAVAAVSFGEAAAAYSLASAVDVLTTGWKFTGKTTINGGAVETDTIRAAQIAAGSVGAKQLVVADTANMAELNEGTAGNITYGWTNTLETVTGTKWSNRSSLSVNQYFMFRNQVGPLGFKTGDRVRLTFEAFADAAVTPSASVWTYKAGGLVNSVNLSVAPTPAGGSAYPTQITTTPQTFAYEGVVPAVTDQDAYLIGISNVLNANVRVRNVRAYRMGAGELIVDGTIEGKHLKANTVTAAQIDAATLTLGMSQITNLNTSLAAKTTTFAQGTIPMSVAAGDLWINTSDGNKMYRAAAAGVNTIAAGAWVLYNDLTAKTTTFAQTTIPTSVVAGDIWINTADQNKMYRAAAAGATTIGAGAWVLVNTTFVTQTFAQGTIPTSVTTGDLWINTSDSNKMYRAAAAGVNTIGAGAWVLVQDVSSLSGKTTTFAQSGIPTSTAVGDLWVNTGDGNKIYRAASIGATTIAAGAWVLVNDITAKTTTFAQSGIPTATTAGDIWINTGDLNKMYRAAAAGANSIAAGAWVLVDSTFYTKTFAQTTIPTSITIGDIWVDTGNQNKLYRAASVGATTIAAGAWVLVNDPTAKTTTFAQTSIPTATAAGDIWVDTTGGVNKMYRAAAIGAATIAAGAWVLVQDPTAKSTTFAQGTIPTSLAPGDIWVNTSDNNKMYRAAASGATTIAAGAWVLVDSTFYTKTFAQGTVPTSLTAGDIWVDTTNQNKIYRAAAANVSTIGAGAWVLVQDPSAKTTTFAQGTIPTAVAVGDIWVNTSDSNKMYRAAAIGANTIAAGQWVIVQDLTTKTTTFRQGTAPTSVAVGDTWYDTANNNRVYISAVAGSSTIGAGGWVEVTDFRVNSWTAPGSTKIDGGQLQTNTVVANAIAARTIGTDKMLIGGVTNVVPNGAGEWGMLGGIFPIGTPNITFDTTDKPAILNGVFKGPAANQTALTDSNPYMFWDAEAGQEFLVEIWVKASVANSRMYVELRDQNNNHATTNAASTTPGDVFAGIAGGQYPMENWIIPTGWTKYTSVATAVAGVTRMRVGGIYFNHVNGAVTNAVQSFAIRVRPRNAGRLIVDGSVEAQKIGTGTLQASTTIYAGNPAAAHAEVTGTGFYVYTQDVEGNPNLAARMGTTANDLIAIVDSSGDTLAGFSETGSLTATGGAIDGTQFDADGLPVGGFSIYGREFMEWVNSRAIGIVASSFSANFQVTSITTTFGLAEVSFDSVPGRNYRLNVNHANVTQTVATDRFCFTYRYTTDGSAPTITSPVFDRQIIATGTTTTMTVPPFISMRVLTTAATTVRILVCLERLSGTGSIQYSTNVPTTGFKAFHLWVEDIGLDVADTFLLNQGNGSIGGGAAQPPPTTAKKTYVKTYASNGWATYRGSNTPLRGSNTSPGDTSSKIYQGYSSAGSFNGDQRGLWTFPSIVPDVTGSTINKIEFYLYAAHWYYNAGGTAFIRLHGWLTPPTSPSPGVSPDTGFTHIVTSASWPKPGGRWITVPSSTYLSFINGTYRGVGVGQAGSTSLTYYGYFNPAASMRVTYTK